jgi:DNA repair exonuclease SbcCD ATPase subunit
MSEQAKKDRPDLKVVDEQATLRDKKMFVRKRKQLKRLEDERKSLAEGLKTWEQMFNAKLSEMNAPLQQQIQGNIAKVQTALNKKTEVEQRRLGEIDNRLPKLRDDVQDLWEKIEGMTDVGDVDVEQADTDDVDDLIDQVERGE